MSIAKPPTKIISSVEIWKECVALIRRESPLLLPLAFATVGIGQAGVILLFGLISTGRISGLLFFCLALCWFWVVFGQLAISALVLKPGSSVGESMSRASHAMPRMIFIAVWLIMMLILITIPFSLLLAKNGLAPGTPISGLSASDYLMISPVLLFALWFSARIYTLYAVLVEESGRSMSRLAKAFVMTRGNGSRLIGVVMLFGIVGQLLQLLAVLIVTVIAKMAIGTQAFATETTIIAALAAGLAGTLPSLGSAVFGALLYKRLTA